jgi:unsaturated rhamnogalacturonyl hydrolase
MDMKQLLVSVADKTIEHQYRETDMNYHIWDWQEGVGMYGLMKTCEVTGDSRYLNFVKEWVDYHIDKGLPKKSINTVIPFTSVLELYKATGHKPYRWLCEETAHFCMCQAKRANEGVLEHTVLAAEFESQIWADTLFMGTVFLARWGKFTGEDMYIYEAIRQLNLHYKYLTDPSNGLMFHAYNCKLRSHMSAIHWGRANGWAVLSSVEILDMIPDYIIEKEIAVDNLNKHVAAIMKYCNENGMWHTVLDRPETNPETTVGAALYSGVFRGIHAGYLSGCFLEQCSMALQGLIKNIGPDGQVLNASGGTPVMNSAEAYNNIPCVMSYYGQGLALMALSAMLKQ